MTPEEREAEVTRVGLLEEVRGAATTAVDGAIERAFNNLDLSRIASARQTDPPDAPPTPAPWLVQLGQSIPEGRVPQAGDVITQTQDGSWLVMPEAEAVRRVRYAAQEQGIMGFTSQLDGIGGFDIPWGSILVGAVPGAIAGELVDGFLPPRNAANEINFVNPVVKVVVGAVGTRMVSQFAGRTAGMLFAGALGVQVLAQFLPLDQWVQNIVASVRGIGGTSTGDTATETQLRQLQEVRQLQLPVVNPTSRNAIVDMLEATPA